MWSAHPALAATSMEQTRVAVCHAFGITLKADLTLVPPTGIYTIPEASMIAKPKNPIDAEREKFLAMMMRRSSGVELARSVMLTTRAVGSSLARLPWLLTNAYQFTLMKALKELLFQEKDKGTLTPGKLADLAVLSPDIFKVPPPDLPKTESVLTVVGRKIIHDAGTLGLRPQYFGNKMEGHFIRPVYNHRNEVRFPSPATS